MFRATAPRLRGACALSGLAIVFVSFASPLKAQSVYTWADAGPDWGTAADWGGTVPTGADIGLFGTGPYANQPNLAMAHAVGGIWSTGSGNVSVTGSTLSLDSTTVNGNASIGIEMDPGAGALTFSNPLGLGGAQTWLNNSGSLLTAAGVYTGASYTLTIAGSGNFTLGGNISGPGGLTMLGSGSLQIAGSNTYSGPTITDGGTLQMTGGQLMGSTLQYVGSANTASFIQSAGTVGAASGLYVGYTATGNGSYALSTGSLASPSQYIGYSGTGSFTQSGGINISNLTAGTLDLGYNAAGVGSYSLNAGTLHETNQYIGDAGTGSFIQSGGSNSATTLRLGNAATGSGSYTLTAGTLASPSQYVGYSGSGSFAQSSGTNTASSGLYLGYNATGVGSYSQSGGLTSAASLYVGYNPTGIGNYTQSGGSLTSTVQFIGSSGTGTFTQSGGTNSTASLYLSGGSGTYNLGNGLLSVSASEQVPGPTYSFRQSGGTNNAGLVSLSGGSLGGGYYLLSAGLLQLNFGLATAGGTLDGGNGAGTIQSGSSTIVDVTGSVVNTASTSLTVGANSLVILPSASSSSEFGVYSNAGMTHVTGSTLNVSAGTGFGGWGTITDPVNCQGTFNAPAGGPINLTNGLALSAPGQINLGSGTLTVNDSNFSGMTGGTLAASTFVVGSTGTGSFPQSGGTASVSSAMYLGLAAGGSGTYTLSGGSLTATAVYAGSGASCTGSLNISGGSLFAFNEYIGYYGSGSYSLSAGTNVANTALYVGEQAGSSGTAAISQSGYLKTSTLGVGATGTGSLAQSGGTVAATTTLYVGENLTSGTGGFGTYNLSGGSLFAASLDVGYTGTGSFTMSGGTASGNLQVGVNSTGSGSYTLSGGSLYCPTFEYIGNSGTGSFTLSGTGSDTAVKLEMGVSTTGTGSLTVSGGSLSVLNNMYVGFDSTKGVTINQSAGVISMATTAGATTPATFFLGYGNGALVSVSTPATYNMNGGSLTGQSIWIGYNTTANATMNQSGGTVAFPTSGGINGVLTVGGSSIGTYNLSGSGVATGYELNLGFGTAGNGNFTQSGGLLSITNSTVNGFNGVGNFMQSGGTDATSEFINGLSAPSGNTPASVGNFTLTAGSVSVLNGFEVGYKGTGMFAQSGGTISCATFDVASAASTSKGTCNITGGQIIGSDEMYVGVQGTGVVSQSGGFNNWGLSTNGVVLGLNPSGVGTYILSGSGILSSSALALGYVGTGVFTQTGGTNDCLGGVGFGISLGGSGTLNLDGGLLNLANGMSILSGQGQFNFGGGTLEALGNISVPMPVNLTGIGTILTNGNAAVFSGPIGGPGGLIYADPGGGLLVLASSNTYSGGTQITSGSMEIGSSSALGSGALAVNGGTLDLSGYSVIVPRFSGAAGMVTNNGAALAALTVSQTGATTFNGALLDGSNPLGLALNGGTLMLSGSNAFSGGTNITGGLLQLGNSAALGGGALAVNAGTLDMSGYSVMAPSFSGAAGTVTNNGAAVATLTVSQTGATTFSGALQNGSAPVGLALTGGTLTLSGSNTYSGGTNINGGLLQLGNSSALGGGALAVDGGTLDLMGRSVLAPSFSGAAGTVTNNGAALAALTVSQTGATTFSGALLDGSSPLGLALTGGTLMLSGSNAFSGGTNVTGGLLQLGNSAALGGGALAADGGTVDLMGNSATVYSLSGVAGTITNSGSNLALFTDSQSGRTTFGGAIQDGAASTALVLSGGTGTLVLTGTNTYTGGTTVSSGELVVDNAYGLATGSNLSVGANVVADFAPLSPAASSQSAGGLPSIAAVPEPGTLALLCAVAAMSEIYPVCRRRNRRRRAPPPA